LLQKRKDMRFEHKILANGLAIVGEVNESAQTTAVGFFVRTGSRDEEPQISGVSHFLEHMVFKGTDKLSPFEVNELFDKTGAKFNAFTSEENTVYYAAILPEYLSDITALWAELMRPALRTDDFNIEKNVIKEEIAMYKDMPHYDVMDRARSLHFDKHPCGHSVLGSNETIERMTADQMRQYFNGRYAPNNISVVCTGNFDWQRFSQQVESLCGGWQSHEAGRNLVFFGGSKLQQQVNKANLVREHICLVSPSVSAQDKRKYAASLLAVIVGDDTGSRYFWELVDSAMAETATMQYEAMDGVGAFYSYIRCSPENCAKVMNIIKEIYAALAANGITEAELQKSKNKVLSALTIKNELPMGRLVDVGFNWTYTRQYLTMNEEIASINAVTIKDVNDLIAEFSPGDFTQLSLGPGP
jgi:predicted Zn-dependent peptidase